MPKACVMDDGSILRDPSGSDVDPEFGVLDGVSYLTNQYKVATFGMACKARASKRPATTGGGFAGEMRRILRPHLCPVCHCLPACPSSPNSPQQARIARRPSDFYRIIAFGLLYNQIGHILRPNQERAWVWLG